MIPIIDCMLKYVLDRNIKPTTPMSPNGKANMIMNGCLNDRNNGVIIKNANNAS